MSRSRRKTPVAGITTSDSEKQDKRLANRRLRRRVREILPAEPDGVLPALREVSSVWCFDKDGKMRFDPESHPRLMRK
ncbi:MAG TPA: hypothetical protein VLK84_26580 [Longimicrobium sp.]|nr:hypothetical protein [Longimicrobium sp.]